MATHMPTTPAKVLNNRNWATECCTRKSRYLPSVPDRWRNEVEFR